MRLPGTWGPPTDNATRPHDRGRSRLLQRQGGVSYLGTGLTSATTFGGERPSLFRLVSEFRVPDPGLEGEGVSRRGPSPERFSVSGRGLSWSMRRDASRGHFRKRKIDHVKPGRMPEPIDKTRALTLRISRFLRRPNVADQTLLLLPASGGTGCRPGRNRRCLGGGHSAGYPPRYAAASRQGGVSNGFEMPP